jgi:hypothetical protein
MKRLIMHSMFAAAAVVAVAGSASAQIMKAEIPFAFRASGTLMQPGTYEVVRINSSNAVLYSLRNRDTKAAVLLSAQSQHEALKRFVDSGMAKLAFACTDNRCALSELWTGGAAAYGFSAPKASRSEAREIALTRSSGKAD